MLPSRDPSHRRRYPHPKGERMGKNIPCKRTQEKVGVTQEKYSSQRFWKG